MKDKNNKLRNRKGTERKEDTFDEFSPGNWLPMFIINEQTQQPAGQEEAQAAPAAVAGPAPVKEKPVKAESGRIRLGAVRALLRKGRQERRSMFKAGQFDFLGFLLRVVLVGAIVALFVIFFGRFIDVYLAVKTGGQTDRAARALEILTILYTAIVLGLVIGGVGQLGRELFSADDMKIYSAMPINARTLFLARLISFYRGQFVIALVCVVTVNATFAWKVGVTIAFWGLSVATCFILPLITMGIAALLVPLFQILKRFVRERYVVLFLVVTALLGVAIFLYSIILDGVKQLLLGDSLKYFFNENVMNTIGTLCDYLYPARWLANILTGVDELSSWIGIAAVCVVSLFASMLIIRRILTRALQARNQSTTAAFRHGYLHDRGTKLGALLKKEFLHIFRTPSYMFSYFSVALIMPLMVYFCMDVGASLVLNLVGIDCNLELALFLTVLFAALTNVFCATNISRDGEMFYAVKAMPVSYKTVILSKLFLCLIVTLISQVATSVLLFAAGMVSLPDALFIGVIGLLFSLADIAVATRYDFNHAKFSTEDDGEIKESSGTVSMVIIVGMLFSFLVGGLVFALKIFSQLGGYEIGYLSYVLSAALCALTLFLALFYLLFRLKRKYYEFSGGGI